MMTCKLRKFIKKEGCGLVAVDFTCDEVRLNFYKLLVERSITNQTTVMTYPDQNYEDYRQTLVDFMKNCKCNKNDSLQCGKCSISDHEGSFCRCESRNIRIAKEQREKGEGAWLKPKEVQSQS